MLTNLIFVFCFLNMFSCSLLNKIEHEKTSKELDTVIIMVEFIKDTIDFKKSEIKIQIINFKKDTLILLPNPFFIESTFLTEKYPWVMWSNKFSTPNIIYIEKELYKTRYQGDAIYQPYFRIMPSIIKFSPNDTINFELKLPLKIIDKISNGNIYISGAIVYTKKIFADSIVSNSSSLINSEYKKKLSYQRYIKIDPIESEKFKELLSKNNLKQDERSISEFILETFNRKFIFEQIR